MQTKGRQTYFENCFLCFRVLMANEFLEQSLHFSSTAHLGCLALEAAALPSSFPTQQFCHPAATTPQAEAQPAPGSKHGSVPGSHCAAAQSATSEFLLMLKKSQNVTWDLNFQLLQQVQLEGRVLLLFHLPQSGTAGFPVDRDRPCSR